MKPILCLLSAILGALLLIAFGRMQITPSRTHPERPIAEISATQDVIDSGKAISYGRSEGYGVKTTYWAAPIEHVLSTPEWTDFPDNPPLSLGEAVSIARRYQSKKGVYAPFIDNVSLYQKPPGSKRWAYRISFDPNTDQRMTKGNDSSTIVVLLDGSVVTEAVFTPKKRR